jgi:hypothetical protein
MHRPNMGRAWVKTIHITAKQQFSPTMKLINKNDMNLENNLSRQKVSENTYQNQSSDV